MSEYGRHGRVALIVPPSNPTVEPEMVQLLPESVALYTQRLPIGDGDLRERLLGYNDALPGCVASFGNLSIDVAYYACTGASYLVGATRDDALRESMMTLPNVGTALTAADSIVRFCRYFRIKRIAMISPYPEWLTTFASEFWANSGLQITGIAHVPLNAGESVYDVTTAALLPVAQELSSLEPDALLLSGTGMPTLETARAVTESTDILTLSSSIAAAWSILQLLGVDHPDVYAEAEELRHILQA